MKKRITGLLFAIAAAAGCSKYDNGADAGEDAAISFYVKTSPVSKAIVEDVGDLSEKKIPIYITDESGQDIKNTPVQYTSNSIWRSYFKWEPRQYSFFAYVYASSESDTKNILSNGKSVTISQPGNYSEKEDDYDDYLFSYRVSADGNRKPLVRLEFERVTSCVELYMTRSPKVFKVQLLQVSFRGLNYSASFNLAYHATSGEEAVGGLKNKWTVKLDAKRTDYDYIPEGGMPLHEFKENKGRYAEENRVMKFLTVPQKLEIDELEIESGHSGEELSNVKLYVKYSVQEKEYDTTTTEYESEFDLGKFKINSWAIGHKVRYYISVDTNIELQGQINEWNTVDFIEGTLLPQQQ